MLLGAVNQEALARIVCKRLQTSEERNVSSALPASTDGPPPGQLPFGGRKSGIQFLNASTGWITGTVGANDLAWLYVSHDGGATWNHQSLPLPPGVPSAQLSLGSPTFFSGTEAFFPSFFLMLSQREELPRTSTCARWGEDVDEYNAPPTRFYGGQTWTTQL